MQGKKADIQVSEANNAKKWPIYTSIQLLYTLLYSQKIQYMGQNVKIELGCTHVEYSSIYRKNGQNTACMQQYTPNVYTDFSGANGPKPQLKLQQGERSWTCQPNNLNLVKVAQV